MSYKAFFATALLSGVLAGCGGSGGDSDVTVQEYDLSDYEDLIVSSDTLAGTWVGVGTNVTDFNDSDNEIYTVAFREYVVITESGNNYSKASCGFTGPDTITVDGSDISVQSLTGSVVDNNRITLAEDTNRATSEDGTVQISTALTYIKISNSIEPFVEIESAIDSETSLKSESCYRVDNGNVTLNNSNPESLYELKSSSLNLTTRGLDSELQYFDPNILYDTYDGDTVVFEVTGSTTLTESISFSASNNASSFVGTVSVQLPVQ